MKDRTATVPAGLNAGDIELLRGVIGDALESDQWNEPAARKLRSLDARLAAAYASIPSWEKVAAEPDISQHPLTEGFYGA